MNNIPDLPASVLLARCNTLLQHGRSPRSMQIFSRLMHLLQEEQQDEQIMYAEIIIAATQLVSLVCREMGQPPAEMSNHDIGSIIGSLVTNTLNHIEKLESGLKPSAVN